MVSRRVLEDAEDGREREATCVFDMQAPSLLPAIDPESVPQGAVNGRDYSMDPDFVFPDRLVGLASDSAAAPDFIKGPALSPCGRAVVSPYYNGLRLLSVERCVEAADGREPKETWVPPLTYSPPPPCPRYQGGAVLPIRPHTRSFGQAAARDTRSPTARPPPPHPQPECPFPACPHLPLPPQAAHRRLGGCRRQRSVPRAAVITRPHARVQRVRATAGAGRGEPFPPLPGAQRDRAAQVGTAAATGLALRSR